MKFDCGPTPEEREAARKAKMKAERKARKDARRNWHRIFAWWPTRVASHDCRWLEWIERREEKVGESTNDGTWYFGLAVPPYSGMTFVPTPIYGWVYRACP